MAGSESGFQTFPNAFNYDMWWRRSGSTSSHICRCFANPVTNMLLKPPQAPWKEWPKELNTIMSHRHYFRVRNTFFGRDGGYRCSLVRLFIVNFPSFVAYSRDRKQHVVVRCLLLALTLNEAATLFAVVIG